MGIRPNQPRPRAPRHYAGTEVLDRLITDPTVPIEDVIREVERLVRRDWNAARYYAEHPELLHPGHPWLWFLECHPGVTHYLPESVTPQ